MLDKATVLDAASSGLIARNGQAERLHAQGYFTAVCVGANGVEKWREGFPNTVMTLGKNDILDKFLKGATYTQTVRMGLAGTGTKEAADTQASHAGWLEVGLANAPTYTGDRKSVTFGAASGGVSTSPVQAFAITSSGTVSGCFLNNGGSATKDDTTGVLISAGNFTEGDRVVVNGDTINVTYTLTL
jgi:hypothetical protein